MIVANFLFKSWYIWYLWCLWGIEGTLVYLPLTRSIANRDLQVVDLNGTAVVSPMPTPIPPMFTTTLPIVSKTTEASNNQMTNNFTAVYVTTPSIVNELEDSLHGQPGQGYYIQLGIGSPVQKLNVLIDTGSSNFAVAATPHQFIDNYFNSSLSHSFVDLHQMVSVPYTQGMWTGYLGRDTIAFSPSLSVTGNIACITQSENFFINGSHWHGILGLGFATIARPDPGIQPLFDSLVASDNMTDLFSVQLCGPAISASETNITTGGSLILGGIDTSYYRGSIFYAPLYMAWYYHVLIADILVNGNSLSLDCQEYNKDKTIVDTGSTNLRLPVSVFKKLISSLQAQLSLEVKPPEDFWMGDAVACWPRESVPWSRFPIVTLMLVETENTIFALQVTPYQYLRLVHDISTEQADGTLNNCYRFAISSSTSGTVIGATVLEAYYVVFDRVKLRIGFAESTCSRIPGVNDSVGSTLSGPFNVSYSPVGCAYAGSDVKTIPSYSVKDIIFIITCFITSLVVLCLIIVVTVAIHWLYYQHTRTDNTIRHCAYALNSSSTSPLTIAAYCMITLCGLCLIPFLLSFAKVFVKLCMKKKSQPSDAVILISEEEQQEQPNDFDNS